PIFTRHFGDPYSYAVERLRPLQTSFAEAEPRRLAMARQRRGVVEGGVAAAVTSAAERRNALKVRLARALFGLLALENRLAFGSRFAVRVHAEMLFNRVPVLHLERALMEM